jgi:hypothetical protein
VLASGPLESLILLLSRALSTCELSRPEKLQAAGNGAAKAECKYHAAFQMEGVRESSSHAGCRPFDGFLARYTCSICQMISAKTGE